MPYITRADLIKKPGKELLEQLTDRDGLGKIDDGVLNDAITEAGVEIDAYLKGRYAVPLSPVPDIIKNKARDLVVYHLYIHEPPDQTAKRYNDAIKFLREVRDGDIDLGVDDPAPAQDGFNMKSSVVSTRIDYERY